MPENISDPKLTAIQGVWSGESVPTTEASPQVTVTALTLEKSLTPTFEENNYDKIGDFDLSSLKVDVLPSGFPIFDKHFVLKKGKAQLVTIAAYTSHGKSAMMMQIAAYVSQMGPVFVHSFEMEKAELETRLLAAVAHMSSEDIMEGKVPARKLALARDEYSKRHLYISKDPNNNMIFVQSNVYEQAKKQGRPALVVVDYLQIMDGPIDRVQRSREISDLMKGLKSLAIKLQCPVLLGCQMNRECERRGKMIELKKGVGEYRPILSDLAEGSSIAHDSDVVLFVTRQEQYDGTRKGKADILCAKNRGGRVFEAEFNWDGATCSFEERGHEKGISKVDFSL